jgi:cytochrome c5
MTISLSKIAALLGLVSATACSSSGASIDTATCPKTSTLTYESFGKAFVSSYCTECHGNNGGVNLGSAANVKANAAQTFKEAANGNSSMPPSGKKAPSADERLKLGEWLSCGAP